MDLQVGRLAATRQTWRQKTVRELLAQIIEEHPKAPESVLRRAFRERGREDDEYFMAVFDYAFDAAMRARRTQIERTPLSVEQRAERAAAAATRAQEHAALAGHIKEQIILLNQEMPNGQRVRHCTLDYMYRLGGAYRRVGKKGSSKLVGQAYNEQQYRARLGGIL